MTYEAEVHFAGGEKYVWVPRDWPTGTRVAIEKVTPRTVVVPWWEAVEQRLWIEVGDRRRQVNGARCHTFEIGAIVLLDDDRVTLAHVGPSGTVEVLADEGGTG